MKRWIFIYGLLAVILGGIGYVGAIPPPPMGDHLTAADVTYENLNNNGDVGSGATQVAVGNHAHATYTTTSHDHNGGDGAAIPDAALSSGATVVSAGAGDSGKFPKLDASGHIDASAINDGDIDHANIGSIGTNSHSTIDTFIASKAASSGLASLDGSTKVIQDPANASTTSIANGIPKANASGLIDSAWLDMVPIGSAYTVTNPSTDRAFNVSSTTINELAAVLGTLIVDMNTLTKGDSYVPVTISAGNLSATNSMCLNGYIEITAAGEVELPTGVQGLAVTVRASGAFAVSIDPAGVEVIVLNGTALAGGNKITSTSSANDTVTMIHNGTNWIVIGPSVFTDGGA